MKKSRSPLVTAAFAGMLLGAASPALVSCGSTPKPPLPDRHACKSLNACQGQGGCQTSDQGCAAKNSCKGRGGCNTAEPHACKGMNACKGQGGCSSGDQGCAGKNSCKHKGGCAVPVKR